MPGLVAGALAHATSFGWHDVPWLAGFVVVALLGWWLIRRWQRRHRGPSG